jgi:CRP-like cAMP-binding protein
MTLLDSQPYSTTARITAAAELTVITRDDIEERLKNADPILRRLLLVLTERVREQTRATAARTRIIR